MRILIIKLSSLGDVIHALPVIDYLHRAAPYAEIDWVVDTAFSELLSGNPQLHRIIPVALRSWKKNPFATRTRREIVEGVSALRERHYDLVFDLQGNIKSGMICLMARGTRKIGFSADYVQERANIFCTNEQVACWPNDHHVQSRYLRVAAAPFTLDPVTFQPSTLIVTSAEDDASAMQFVAPLSRPLLLLHTGTTWSTKLWHREGWQQLGKSLLDATPDAHLLLSWNTPEEHEEAAALKEIFGSRALLTPRLPLKRFIALLKKCDLVVGGDTGPIHLAAAVGSPTVSFYRCTDGRRNGPRGERHLIVQSPLSCTACLRKSCDRDRECRQSIDVQTMLEACQCLIAKKYAVAVADSAFPVIIQSTNSITDQEDTTMGREYSLEDALKLAIKAEKDSMDFYARAASIAKNERAKKVFEMLAAEEAVHVKHFFDHYKGGEFGDIKTFLASPVDTKNPTYMKLEKAISEDAGEKKALELALEEEKECIGQYTQLAAGVVDPMVKAIFERVVKETQGHYDLIEAEYAHVMGMVNDSDMNTFVRE